MRRALLATLARVQSFPAAAAAQPRLALFPTPMTQLTPTPPFQPPYNVPAESLPPPDPKQRGDLGRRRRRTAASSPSRPRQRLVLTRTGDYRLTVPAPVNRCRAGARERVDPRAAHGRGPLGGFRRGAKGPRRQGYARPTNRRTSLPLTVTISDGSVRLQNATGTATRRSAPTATAPTWRSSRLSPSGPGRPLARARDIRARAWNRHRGACSGVCPSARGRAPRWQAHRGRAGRRKARGAHDRSTRTAGDRARGRAGSTGRPASSPPRAELGPRSSRRRSPPAPQPLRRGRPDVAHAGAGPAVQGVSRQPGPARPGARSYLYRTVAAPAPVPAPLPTSDAGLAAWALALIAAGSLAAVGGLAVLWANS